MWNKRGCIGRPQAFAEQHSAWTPKWYTCSFCRREFQSAQALGGHMNVHRRDRVRLKQCSDSSSPQPTDNTLIPGRCLAVQLKLWKESSKLREEIHNRHAERKYVEDNHDEGKSSKRSRNSTIVSPLPKAQELLPAEVLKLGSCMVEELDLELRLGYPHKIK